MLFLLWELRPDWYAVTVSSGAVPGLDAGVQVKLKVASSLYLYAEPKVGIRTDTYDGSEQGRPDRVASMVGGLLYRFKMPTFQ